MKQSSWINCYKNIQYIERKWLSKACYVTALKPAVDMKYDWLDYNIDLSRNLETNNVGLKVMYKVM